MYDYRRRSPQGKRRIVGGPPSVPSSGFSR